MQRNKVAVAQGGDEARVANESGAGGEFFFVLDCKFCICTDRVTQLIA